LKAAPAKNELYPAWQGMHYMHKLIDKRSKIDNLNDDRYPEIKWTSVKEILRNHLVENNTNME
jgi:hypothetical protein